ncbi:MAG: glutamine--fructose-6-phosphate transaminase (isomerizing) [bacterium]
MCGIVGYIGKKNAVPLLVEGLKRLEYRGYDSAGIAVLPNGKVEQTKSMGKLARLESVLKQHPLSGSTAIGHTRWATHGRPSDRNAHPHSDCKGEIAVVHNGIIENYLGLKEKLKAKGHRFRSETDTEILAHLIEEYYDCSLEEAVRKALREVQGSYAIGVISVREPGVIVAARKESPLLIGLGKGEYFIASDIPAFLSSTREALLMQDEEMAVLSKDGVRLSTLAGEEVVRGSFEVLWDAKMAEKGGYKHFMLKEIFEQPKVVLDTLAGRYQKSGKIVLENLNLNSDDLKNIKKIFIVACGTAYHAGMVGKYLLEELTRIPVETDLASEFRYRSPLVDKHTLLIAVSQSGETADTLAAVKEARRLGARTLAITNVVGSSISREVDGLLYTRAGIEIGVAATKTFVAQLVAFYLLSFHLACLKEKISKDALKSAMEELLSIPQKIDYILNSHAPVKAWAQKFYKCQDFLYLGRHLSFPIALEGALKLKEISYIHAEGYAAGEMKHGPIALIDENVPVLSIITEGNVYDKILSNVKEVKAREAVTIGIATQGDAEARKYVDHLYHIPRTSPIFSPILAIIPLQLLAYYIADRKGCDVDQPRNLAKSVTVE